MADWSRSIHPLWRRLLVALCALRWPLVMVPIVGGWFFIKQEEGRDTGQSGGNIARKDPMVGWPGVLPLKFNLDTSATALAPGDNTALCVSVLFVEQVVVRA